MVGEMSMESVVLRDLWGPDLHKGFFETLAALRKIELTPEKAAEILRRRLAMGLRTIVAVVGDRIVGTASYIVEEKFYGKVSHVEDVAVHSQFKGQRIGQRMIEEIITRSKDAGCYKVILDCDEHMVAYYERAGFRKCNNGMRRDL